MVLFSHQLEMRKKVIFSLELEVLELTLKLTLNLTLFRIKWKVLSIFHLQMFCHYTRNFVLAQVYYQSLQLLV